MILRKSHRKILEKKNSNCLKRYNKSNYSSLKRHTKICNFGLKIYMKNAKVKDLNHLNVMKLVGLLELQLLAIPSSIQL